MHEIIVPLLYVAQEVAKNSISSSRNIALSTMICGLNILASGFKVKLRNLATSFMLTLYISKSSYNCQNIGIKFIAILPVPQPFKYNQFLPKCYTLIFVWFNTRTSNFSSFSIRHLMVRLAFVSSIRIIDCERIMVTFGRIPSIWALRSNNSLTIKRT